jgi:hypothetical protein
VHFTPAQEAELAQIATRAGTDAERLVKDDARGINAYPLDASRRSGLQQISDYLKTPSPLSAADHAQTV